MHAFAVLAEIVRAGPNLFLFRAIHCGTAETFVRYIHWCYFVYTFFMPVQIVLGAESFVSGTMALLAFERLRVPNLVLSGGCKLQVRLVSAADRLVLTFDRTDS